MKIFAYILLLLILSPSVSGQVWYDTLRAARDSYTRQQYDQAFKQYNSAQKLAPKEVDLSDEIAQSAYRAEKYATAEKLYAKNSAHKTSAEQKSKMYRNIGNSRMKQQKYEEAIESYKEALRNNPRDDHSRYNLTEAMRRQKAQKQRQDQQQKQQQQPKDDQSGEQPPNTEKDQQKNTKQEESSASEKRQSDSGKKTKLSDKKTERMLDELMRQEMETKKKFEGTKNSAGSSKKSGKDW